MPSIESPPTGSGIGKAVPAGWNQALLGWGENLSQLILRGLLDELLNHTSPFTGTECFCKTLMQTKTAKPHSPGSRKASAAGTREEKNIQGEGAPEEHHHNTGEEAITGEPCMHRQEPSIKCFFSRVIAHLCQGCSTLGMFSVTDVEVAWE
ncbi:hypothetical protein AOLI_G00174920 [Acnodon oligacanthus]